jgi:hypothetical protein
MATTGILFRRSQRGEGTLVKETITTRYGGGGRKRAQVQHDASQSDARHRFFFFLLVGVVVVVESAVIVTRDERVHSTSFHQTERHQIGKKKR